MLGSIFLLTYVFLSFTLTGMATDVDTYSANSTHMYSNTDWGSHDQPKYYMQFSYRDSNNNWHDLSRVFVIQKGSPLDKDVSVSLGSGNGMWQDQNGQMVTPVRWQGSVDTSYTCGLFFICWHTAVSTGWWYLTPSLGDNGYTFYLYWTGHQGSYSAFGFNIHRTS